MNKINLILIASKTGALLIFLGIISTIIFAISPSNTSPSQNLINNDFEKKSHVQINSVDEIEENDIVYIESVERYVNVHFTNGTKKFVGKSFKEVVKQYPFLVAVRGKASQGLGSKISVNSTYACFDEMRQTVNVEVWRKSIQPSENLKALVSYSLDKCN